MSGLSGSQMIHLLGVLQDGSVSGPNVPLNPRVTLRIAQETDTIVVVQVVDAAGVPVNMNADVSSTLALTVRVATGIGSPRVLSLCLIAQPMLPIIPSKRKFVIPAAATKPAKLPNGPGRYVYDVVLTLNGQRSAVIPSSVLVIEPAVGLL